MDIAAFAALILLNISILNTVLKIKSACYDRAVACNRRFCRLELNAGMDAAVDPE